MAVDLFGDTYVDNWEYARKVVTLGMNLPFYKVSSVVLPSNGLSIRIFLEGFGTVQPRFSELDVPGLYAIYEKTSRQQSCLYVGATDYSMHQRVYRFVKELHDLSRDDENHPAARKARLDGVTPHNLYVKLFPRTMLPIMENMHVDFMTLDETCAILLKSRYNSRRTY